MKAIRRPLRLGPFGWLIFGDHQPGRWECERVPNGVLLLRTPWVVFWFHPWKYIILGYLPR